MAAISPYDIEQGLISLGAHMNQTTFTWSHPSVSPQTPGEKDLDFLHRVYAALNPVAAVDDGFAEPIPSSGKDPLFEINQRVEKKSGYRYPGIVRSRFETYDGWRYDCEADHPDFKGMLHIFSEAQLKPREKND